MSAARRRREQARKRRRLEAAIEAAIDALDITDGDSDFEPDDEAEDTHDAEMDLAEHGEPDGDDEPSHNAPVSGMWLGKVGPRPHSGTPYDPPLRPPAPLVTAPEGYAAIRVLNSLDDLR